MKIFQNIKYRIADYIQQKKALLNYSVIPTPKILFIILLYSASISLFLAGVRHIQVQQTYAKIKNMQAARKAASPAPASPASQEDLLPSLQNHLAQNIFRLHITADSNTVKDQSVKLKVRDEIIDYLRESIKNVDSPAQAEERITPQIPRLTEIARNTLARYGCDSSVHITIENRPFPVKTYGDLTFPAGTYRALCVDIGTAQGQNWWCVLFPSLCLVDQTTATVPEESKEKLREGLTEEEYRALEQSAAPSSASPATPNKKNADTDKMQNRPEVRSGILDWF